MSKNTLNNLPKWDLSDLYPSKNSKELKQDLETSFNLAKKFEKSYKGKIGELEEDFFLQAIQDYESIQDLIGKISSYSYLLLAENMLDNENASFHQNISEKVNTIVSDIMFFELEINKLDDNIFNNKLAFKKISKYKPWLENIRITKPYQLSDDIEKLLHEKNITSCYAWHRLFDETLASLSFDLDNVKLTFTEISNLLSSPDAKTREKAAKEIGRVLSENSNIFVIITNILAKDKSINDRWRGFKKPISSRNLDNLIEDEVTDSLINTVKENYKNLSHRYYKLKAKWFHTTKLPFWDRNAPLESKNNEIIPWEKAVNLVIEAYQEFSPRMAKIGKVFFDKNWIDAQIKNGKESGAFSHPTVPSAHPYILLNYQGKTKDVMTLAHELGHGIHQVLSSNQGALLADTPLTLAETASIFGEQLAFRKMLSIEKNQENKKIMIAGKVEDMLNTVVRQIAFCDFEKLIHNERLKGELTKEQICAFWMKVQSESLGSSINLTKEYEYYWSYIPHFIHTPFYVYAYAFGECIVNSIYSIYIQKADGFEEKYIKMLQAGGSIKYDELISSFGLNAKSSNFWQNGLNMISDFIDQLED